MNRWVGKLAIVTGASSGIGEAISKALVHEGVNVLGLARREERLKELSKSLAGCKGSFYFMRCDVQNEKDILDAFEYAEKIFNGVDILINNAGIIKLSSFEETKTEDLREVLNINALAPAICSREALKSMRKHQRECHIININSILGQSAKTRHHIFNMYPASKFAMRALADTLRSEIAEKKDKIRICSIYPGYVRTEIIGPVEDFKQNVGRPVIESSDIADSVLFVLSTPLNVQVEDMVINPLHGIA